MSHTGGSSLDDLFGGRYADSLAYWRAEGATEAEAAAVKRLAALVDEAEHRAFQRA